MWDESRPKLGSLADAPALGGDASSRYSADQLTKLRLELERGGALLEPMREAVAWMKDAEETTGQRVHNAERELRMAGVELASMLANFKEGERMNDTAVRAHTMQARRVAVVAIVSHVSDEAYALQKNVGQAMLLRHFPDYGNFFAQISKVAPLARESAESNEARRALLKWYREEWPGVKKSYQSLRAVEPAILDEKHATDEAKRRDGRRFYITVAITVIVGIVGVIVGRLF